jgi:2',3'-cyclic-nucleotide 2'-phosphodiesterase (5'-nucleotidase family)
MESCAMIRRVLPFLALACLAATAVSDDPSLGATAAGQAVADALKEAAGSEIALVPAGVLKDTDKKDDLGASLAFEGDGIIVVKVTGAKLREALERAVSAFPQPSVGFLQVAGLEASFKKSAPANSRITSVTVGASKLEDGKTYTVAMPLSLQQGQLGYANLWEDSKIVKRIEKATMGTVVKGRRVGSFLARWSPQA